MSGVPNTVFLRLEGPMQSWGDPAMGVMRRTMDAPTKSGVFGLICCAMGKSRQESREHLALLNEFHMGVRIDRAGDRWWDYHTVGAGIGLRTAEGGIKSGAQGTQITRREYLADASFLVALQGGNTTLLQDVIAKLRNPDWPIYLGRKSCPPATPIFAGAGDFPNLESALRSEAQPWQSRINGGPDTRPEDGQCVCVVDAGAGCAVPTGATEEVWYDKPVSFNPPYHEARLVWRMRLPLPKSHDAFREHTRPAPPPRANYQNAEYKKRRERRLDDDHHLCVFCKSPATTVQHITYRHAGGNEMPEELRSLCRLCHDAVTMIEYGLGMGLDRINPEEEKWRGQIIEKRNQIIAFRSLETRRRRLEAEEVE